MTNRQSLLAAIKATPDDDLPRLVYRDWLEEFGEGDRDAATVEYIRLSCGIPREGIGSRKAASCVALWLMTNWKRLVPTLTKDFDKFMDEGEFFEMVAQVENHQAEYGLDHADWLHGVDLGWQISFLYERHRQRTWQRWKNSSLLFAGIPILVHDEAGDSRAYVCSVKLLFNRGFLWLASWQAPRLGEVIAAMVAKDQPLADQNGPGRLN